MSGKLELLLLAPSFFLLWLLFLLTILAKARKKVFGLGAQFLQSALAAVFAGTALGAGALPLLLWGKVKPEAFGPLSLSALGGLLALSFLTNAEREAKESVLETTPLVPIKSAAHGLVKVRGRATPAKKLLAPLLNRPAIYVNFIEERLVREPLPREELIEELKMRGFWPEEEEEGKEEDDFLSSFEMDEEEALLEAMERAFNRLPDGRFYDPHNDRILDIYQNERIRWRPTFSVTELAPFWLDDGTGRALVVPRRVTHFATSPKRRWLFFRNGRRVADLPSALDAKPGETRAALKYVPPGATFTVWGRFYADWSGGRRVAKIAYDSWFDVLAIVEKGAMERHFLFPWGRGQGAWVLAVLSLAFFGVAGFWGWEVSRMYGVVLAVAGGLVFFGFLLALWVVNTYNKLVQLRERVDEAWRNVDVILQKRHDLIPNLWNVARAYAEFEREVLERVVELRAEAARPGIPLRRRIAIEREISDLLSRLFAVVEQYPRLTSAQHLMEVINALRDLETQIADRREVFNEAAYHFNSFAKTFPASLVASAFGFEPTPYFHAGERAREVPRVPGSLDQEMGVGR